MTDYELLQALDRCAQEVSRWEAGFLDSMLRRGEGYWPRPGQRGVMREMAERYLDPQVWGEWKRSQ